jgi:PAS domain S-box-containing protein
MGRLWRRIHPIPTPTLPLKGREFYSTKFTLMRTLQADTFRVLALATEAATGTRYMANKDTKSPATGQAAHPSGRIQVQATDEQLRQMLEQVKAYAIFLLDPQGHVSSWNAGAFHITGYRAAEIVGKHFSLLYPKAAVKSGVPQQELEVAFSKGSLEQEDWLLRKDGSRFWASVTITALSDQTGELVGFGAMVRDATERHNAEEAVQKSRTMYERLFENAPDAVVVVDSQGMIRKVNQQAEELFGYPREEMTSFLVEQLIPERYHEHHVQHRHSYFADPQVRRMGSGVELYGRNRDGREIPLDIMLNPIETSEGIWSFAVIRDITQQKNNSDRITDLNAALKNQVEQLTASNQELQGFSYTISHDLRAPLRHILGFVDLLNARDTTSFDEKSRHYLEVITEAARKMSSLIEGLLDFSRMGRTELHKVEIDFDRLVRDVVNRLVEETGEREIEWEIAPLPAVVGDAAMLRQVMVNLIENAVKFTRQRAPAKIEIGTVDESDQTLIYVRDNGVGFDIKYVDKIFGLFQRLHTTEEFEGTGVGLANVQRVIVRHGGRVWAESALDGGATIWFSLPKTV